MGVGLVLHATIYGIKIFYKTILPHAYHFGIFDGDSIDACESQSQGKISER